MSVSWPSSVNSKFYNISSEVLENTISQEFESGKKRKYLKNSSMKKSYSVSFSVWSETEEAAFWTWYDEELLSGSELLSLTDLMTQTGTTDYQIAQEPSCEGGQYPKVITLSLNEA